MIVAIDGPSGTGKSTTARLLSQKLDFQYIDSGALYRGITLLLIKNKINPKDKEKIENIVKNTNFEFKDETVIMNGNDVTNDIRTIEVNNSVSSVSKIKEIRELICEKQRTFVKGRNTVIEGRDIGTVVFPEAEFKFYLNCDINTRAARRQQDFLDSGIKVPIEKIMKELEMRDEIDKTRKISPLKKAEDAIEVDTTNMIIEEQVDFLLKKIINSEKYQIIFN
jgi:cytidylate kinase